MIRRLALLVPVLALGGSVVYLLVGLESPRNQFAIVVDGTVLSAPAVIGAITNGDLQISGSFDESSARELAARLDR